MGKPKAFVRKNWPLMSAGKANGINYSIDVIRNAFNETVWDRKTTSLFLDHQPYEASTWVGEVKNLHIDGQDLKGDIYIYDLNTINKLEAGAKFGISPELEGEEENGEMKKMRYLNFSVVFEPAVKTTYLNDEGNRVRTRYVNQKFFLSADSEKEIIIEQVVDPAISRFCFVDSEGNLCRWSSQNGRKLNMKEENKKLEEEREEENRPEDNKPEPETNQELSEIKTLLNKVLEENKEIKEKLAKKSDEKDKKKEEYPEPEELKKKKKDKYPEYPELEEENRQKLGEELSEEILEALKEFNSEYTDFVKKYISEHKGEGSIAELMKKAAKEWKEKQKEEKEEEAKKSLQESRQTVPQTSGEQQKQVEVQLSELDTEVAKFLLEQQSAYSEVR